MHRLVAWLIGHGGRVVAGVLVVSLALGLAAVRLELGFREGDLLPQGHPFIAVHNRYHRNFSEANVLSVMLEARSGTIFTAPILATIYRATEAVDALPGVNHDQVTSVAHRSTRWARVRPGGMIAREPIVLRPPQQEAEDAEIRREALQPPAFRPTISGGLAALWGFGLMRLTGFALNPLTLVIPFLITARAVSHSAQMHDRYYEELARGRPKSDAIGSSFVGLFAPTMAGILTDALGVLAIAIVAIPALRQLAVTATLWLLSLIVTELLLNPIVYSRLRAPDPRRIRARETAWPARALDRLARGVLGPRGRWVALGGAAVVAAVAVALLPSVRIGDPASASRVLAADAEYNQSHRAVQGAFGGSEPFMVVAEGDGRDALQRVGVLRTIESFQRALERTPVVGASFSLVDILKSMGQLFHELEPRWAVIPEEEPAIRTMFFTYWGSVFPSTSTQYFTPDFATAPITFYCRDHTVEHVRALVAAARAFITAHPLPHVQFRLAGGFIGIMAAIYDEILRSQARMTVASFLVIFLVLVPTYRSVTAAVLLIIPLALANVVVNAYMAARGVGLDLNTLPVIGVGVGLRM